jgi:hypothetical protein
MIRKSGDQFSGTIVHYQKAGALFDQTEAMAIQNAACVVGAAGTAGRLNFSGDLTT